MGFYGTRLWLQIKYSAIFGIIAGLVGCPIIALGGTHHLGTSVSLVGGAGFTLAFYITEASKMFGNWFNRHTMRVLNRKIERWHARQSEKRAKQLIREVWGDIQTFRKAGLPVPSMTFEHGEITVVLGRKSETTPEGTITICLLSSVLPWDDIAYIGLESRWKHPLADRVDGWFQYLAKFDIENSTGLNKPQGK